jgi:hypothetical protein
MGHVTFEPAPRLKSVDETRQSATRKWLVGVWAISTVAATTGWWAGLAWAASWFWNTPCPRDRLPAD